MGKTIITNPSLPPTPPDQNPALSVGQIVKTYEIRQLIARGGFGAVYRAYQPVVDREVALKVILPEYANHPNFIRRFEAEAQLVARLEHLHIVPLYDYWREPDSACLVMRWLRGGSLQDSLDRNEKWSLDNIARLLDQIASALAAAHRVHVVHRDLKPGNILLDEEGNAFLADFGIAKKLVANENAPVTDDDRLGSPAYISPEQVMGNPISPQSDIYSLGVVLYMMLTGETPFFDPSTTTVIRKHVTEPIPALQITRPDLPQSLNMVIWRATAKLPEARYPDALTMAAEFRSIVAAEGLGASGGVFAKPVNVAPTNKTIIVDIPSQRKNPYKGLQAFQEGDAADFFGRKALIDRLARRLAETGSEARFLAVVGASGSGKSSAVKAGLIPALRRGILFGSQDWFIVQMVPGAQPFQELEAALLRIAVNKSGALGLHTDENSLANALKRVIPVENAEVMLVIDQFEELFTLVPDEGERTRFLNSLVNAVTAPDSRLRVLVTLRADFYDKPLQYARFAELMRQRTEVVLPLTSDEMEEAIVSPAHWMGYRFEPGLVAQIISDLSQQPGALPLLQYALTELFARSQGAVFTMAAYKETGGVFGSLARRADELYEGLDMQRRTAVRQLFLRLVRLGDGSDDTRRRLRLEDLIGLSGEKGLMQEIIDLYGQYRLLTFDYEPSTRAPTVEVAHEALIRDWSRLKQWLNSSRDELRLQQRLAQAAREWKNNREDGSYLAAGSRLAQFEALMQTSTLALNPDEKRYLEASTAARQRATQRLRLFVAGLGVVAVVALLVALFAFDQRSVALTERSLSRSRELAVTALTGVNEPDLALLLSLQALDEADTFEARNSLLSLLQVDPRLAQYLHGQTNAVRAVAASLDGRWLAVGGRGGIVTVWDMRDESTRTLAGHQGDVNSVAFSADGTQIVTGGADGTVRLWDVTTGEPVGSPTTPFLDERGNPFAVWSVALGLDGRAAAGYVDGTIRLWARGELLETPAMAHTDGVYALAYSLDGTVLASGGGDNLVRLWDAATGTALTEPLAGHTNWVMSLAYSPDGSLFVTSGIDGTLILWDVSGVELARLDTGHTDYVRDLAFNADGSLLASASADGTVRLWDMAFGEAIGEPMRGHAGAVWGAAFIDDHQLISGGIDGKVIKWDTTARPPFTQVLATAENGILSIAYSPDRSRIALAQGDLRSLETTFPIQILDAQTGEVLLTLSDHTGVVTAVAYSPDGNRLVSASPDRTLRVWDAQTGALLRTITNDGVSTYAAVAISPDGKTLASGSDAGAVLLWHMDTGERLGDALTGHSERVISLNFSPDGQRLVSGSMDDSATIWNLASRQGIRLAAHIDDVAGVVFSPDSTRVASASVDGTVILWDANTGQVIGQPLIGHDDIVETVAFSPNGQVLASGDLDGVIRLWDVASGRAFGRPLTGHTDGVWTLAFDPNGQTLASGALDASVRLWDLQIESWRARACQIANRELTTSEAQRYFQEKTYQPVCD